jgi:hypothetical protein
MIAPLNREMGRYSEARQLYGQVLQFCAKTLEPEHVLTVQVLDEYAKLLREMGDHAEAIRLEERVGAVRSE